MNNAGSHDPESRKFKEIWIAAFAATTTLERV
jgi:hypothetical protein